jgi:hypothetical protein
MALLGAALLFGAADMWFAAVPTYGAQAVTVGNLWALISVRSMNAMQLLITHHLWSPLWNLGISPVLVAPAWSFFGALGFIFFVLGRPNTSER